MKDTATGRDLSAMADLVRAGYDDEPADGLPRAVTDGLRRLVSCDSVCFFPLDARHERCGGQGCLHEPDLTRAFWSHYWDCPPCSYPERSGDFRSVMKTSDFYSERQWRGSPMYSDYLCHFGVGHELIACLPAGPGRSMRLLLRREQGDFGERDRQVVTLLRPHLHEIYQDSQRRRAGAPRLTHRQWEVLRLVAAGLSNAGIAAQLGLSDGTVRKHLENIFERMGVSSRTAAVARAAAAVPPHNERTAVNSACGPGGRRADRPGHR
jgi:DNA-binding CsgD family transcriptional regulator